MSVRFGAGVDRRKFLGAGIGVTVAALAPSALHAGPSLVPPSQIEPLGRWSRAGWSEWAVDDMWNHLPRATARLGLGRRRAECSVDVAAIDRQFCG